MIALRLGGDDALQLMQACDTATTALLVPAYISRAGLSIRECDHALIQFRSLRANLLRARADYIQQVLKKEKPV